MYDIPKQIESVNLRMALTDVTRTQKPAKDAELEKDNCKRVGGTYLLKYLCIIKKYLGTHTTLWAAYGSLIHKYSIHAFVRKLSSHVTGRTCMV